MIGTTRTIDMTFPPRTIGKTIAFYIGPRPGASACGGAELDIKTQNPKHSIGPLSDWLTHSVQVTIAFSREDVNNWVRGLVG